MMLKSSFGCCRCLGGSPVRLAGGGLRQPFTHQLRLKFGTELQPAKRSDTIHSYPVLPAIPFQPTLRSTTDSNIALTTLKQRQKSQGSMILYYKIPLLLVEGRGQYLFDEQGHRYLDMFGYDGLIHVGHCHPLVAESVTKQSTKLMHLSHHFLSEESSEFTKALLAKMPSELNSVFLVNSESEAIELAALLARLYTKNHDLLSLRGSYFGFTHLANSLSGLSFYKFPSPQAHGVIHLGIPDFFRNPVSPRQAIELSVKDVVSTLRSASSGNVAGCIIETLQSLGGVVPVKSQFLEQLCQVVRSRGGLILMDEGSSGLGRLGTHFWGFQRYSIQPDIVVITKGLANGLPFAAVVTKQEIAVTLQSRLYANLYAGNPICCVAATAVLKAIERDGLQENAAFLASYLDSQLRNLQKKFPESIGNVTTLGLNAGIEFVKSSVTKEPAPQVAASIHEAMKNRGVILGKGGQFGNVLRTVYSSGEPLRVPWILHDIRVPWIRISPPLCVIQEDIEYMVGQCVAALDQLHKHEDAIEERRLQEIQVDGESRTGRPSYEKDGDRDDPPLNRRVGVDEHSMTLTGEISSDDDEEVDEDCPNYQGGYHEEENSGSDSEDSGSDSEDSGSDSKDSGSDSGSDSEAAAAGSQSADQSDTVRRILRRRAEKRGTKGPSTGHRNEEESDNEEGYNPKRARRRR